VQNFTLLNSAIPELVIYDACTGSSPTVNQHPIYEILCFTRSKNMTGAAKYKMGHVNLTTPIKVHFVISLLVLDTFIQNMTSPCAGNSELRSPL